MDEDLTKKRCVPCEGGVPRLQKEEARAFLAKIPAGWEMHEEGTSIAKTWKRGSFREAIAFVNDIARIAEEENHHPDIRISYATVSLELWTHAIDGLSENDFILAAKIEASDATRA